MVKRLTRDFVIETSSVNEAHNHLTAPISRNYFRMSWKLSTTAVTKVVKLEYQKFQMYLIMLKCDYYFAWNAIFWSVIGM
jgi:UPF0288 family protein (methanogenesis marker protein 3)